MSLYYAGQAGDPKRGKLHLFPEAASKSGATLRTVCRVEKQVGFLLRSNVDEEPGPQSVEQLAEEHGDRLCVRCLRRAEDDG